LYGVGDDGTLANQQQFSLYGDFGQNDLFSKSAGVATEARSD
jgi:hypothetical protein